MEKTKRDVYLANTAKAIDFGYWYGTYGQMATNELWNSKSGQYPDWYKDPSHADELRRWLGKQVVDCIGLDKFARWLQPDGSVKYKGDGSPDLSADGMFKYAKEMGMTFGPIATIPDVPGICVRKPGHFGIYLGKGVSRESRGGDWGVEDYPVMERSWTDWYYNPFIDYTDETIDIDYTVICTALNARSGPGTDNDIVAVMHNGDILHVTEVLGSWGKHQAGWSNISSTFCKLTDANAESPIPTVQPEPEPINHNTIETYASWPVLRYGMKKNSYVRQMQTALILKGYNIPAGATGNYLDQTATAVLAFLKDADLVSNATTSVRNVAWGKRCWFALLG